MSTPSLRLSGKRALVTGAARGIGAAIALKLAEDGADVAITYEKSADLAEDLAARNRAPWAARPSPSRPTPPMPKAVKDARRADRRPNSAASTSSSTTPAICTQRRASRTSRRWNRSTICSTSMSAASSCHPGAIWRTSPQGGRIISIGSCLRRSRRRPPASPSMRRPSRRWKASTKGLARELGSREITVNLVKPGPIDTDMNPPTVASRTPCARSWPWAAMAKRRTSPRP
jgi:3-oxoacyl-[acyl-carrier protein] reductase